MKSMITKKSVISRNQSRNNAKKKNIKEWNALSKQNVCTDKGDQKV